MAKPRTPIAKAKVAGRDAVNPGRFKDRKEPSSSPLGGPSSWMKTELQHVAWEAFRKEMPWLMESHRAHVEIAAKIRARLMADDAEEVGIQALNLLRQCIGQMGGNPADASKVAVPDGEADEPEDRFFN